MCTAILNKHNLLPKSIFDNILENNPDGIGIGFVQSGTLRVYKDLDSTDRIYKIYEKFRSKHSTPVMIHARIGTAGSRDKANVHPYRVNKDILMMHNGIVSIGSLNTSKSDTWHVARAIAKFRNPSNVLSESSHEYNLIDTVCGSSSKFIFLDTSNRYCIMNASAGHYDKEGNWYSNYNYQKTDYYDVGGKKVRKGAYSESYNDQYEWDSYKSYLPKKQSLEDAYNGIIRELCIALGRNTPYGSKALQQEEQAMCDEYGADNAYEVAVYCVEYNLVPISDSYYIERAMTKYEDLYYNEFGVLPLDYVDTDSTASADDTLAHGTEEDDL